MNSIELHYLELYLVYVYHIFPQYFMANFLERFELVGLKLSISSFPKSGYDNYIWHKKLYVIQLVYHHVSRWYLIKLPRSQFCK